MILTDSTSNLSAFGIARKTLPDFPLSLPDNTATLSPFLTRIITALKCKMQKSKFKILASPQSDDNFYILHCHFDFLFLNFKLFYMTSGAKEASLVKPFSLISRGIGPKILPPLGSMPSRITTAFSSNWMYDPSSLRYWFFCRTTTALTTSDFLTAFLGSADFTAPTIISPMEAYLRRVPPSTLKHWTIFAPELSATFNIDRG